MKITKATVADAALCRKLEKSAYGKAATLRQWQSLLQNSHTVALCCPNGVAVVVNSVLVVLAVDAKSQRMGVGRKLIREMQRLQPQLRLRLPETNLVALKFAAAVGFRSSSISKDFYGAGVDAIWLQWSRSTAAVVTEIDTY